MFDLYKCQTEKKGRGRLFDARICAATKINGPSSRQRLASKGINLETREVEVGGRVSKIGLYWVVWD